MNHVDGEDAEQDAARREIDERGTLVGAGIFRVGQVRFARPAEKDDGVELDHHVRRQRHGQHECGRGQRNEHVDERLRQARRKQECLQQQPFGNEAVEWRNAGDRQRADEREPGHPRHPVDQATELAEVALLGCMQHRARREKQEAFEKRVVERVIEHCRQRDRGKQRLVVGLEQYRQADPCDDDADVFDRRVREEALHVGLHCGEYHAEQRGRKAQRERDNTPPPELAVDEIECHAQQSVDRRFQHHAAHECRYRRRRRRVRLGQPNVQRQQPRLGAEAEKCEKECNRGPGARQDHGTHRIEGVVAVAPLQHTETKKDGDRADMRDQ